MSTSVLPALSSKRQRIAKRRLILLACSSALLMALALPNEVFKYGFPLLGLLAVAPLWIAFVSAESYGMAALIGSCFGALQHSLTSYWLWFFKDFAFWTLGTTTLTYALVYAVFGLYLGYFARKSSWGRPLAFALLWACFEYLKSNGFLGYPWGLLPYSLTQALPLLQIADITGVYGISFVLALVNGTLAEILLPGRERSASDVPRAERGFPFGSSPWLRGYALFSMLLVALIAGYGFVRMAIPVPKLGSFRALINQQDVDPWNTGDTAAVEANIRLSRAAMEAKPQVRPDLILFSESSLGAPYEEGRRFYTVQPKGDPLIPFIKASGTYLFTGAPDVLSWEPLRAMNSVILIDPQSRLVASYGKVHPVPFAEAIPFWEYAPFRNFMQRVVGLDSGWVMGTEYTLFSLPTEGGPLRFGAPICFEDAFASVCRQFMLEGADLLVNLTNDSWSTTESAEIQHWAAARFRSIEFRTTLVRSTNGGLSCVVGPYGELRDALPLFKPASELVEVPVYRPAQPTLYERFGDWFAQFLLLLSVGWAIILLVKDFGFAQGQRR